MKKRFKTTTILLILMLGLLIGANSSSAANLATTLKGKILLQVEQNGEAWYVNPSNGLRYYLGRPADAFSIMRELGLGISNNDFDSFNGYAPSRLSGKILLKVYDSGKAYYVNPVDLKMHYLGRPADAFRIMRELGLGITDKNLNLINKADLKTLKGWLEGTRSPLNLVLAETTATFSGYSGNKFALVFSKDSLCTLAETESAFSCTDSSQKWGYGDRVRVYGSVTNNQILVNKLEIVSNLPLSQW